MAMPIILGIPLVAWGGLATLICLMITFLFGFLVHVKHMKLFKWHMRMAVVTLLLGLGHGAYAFLWIWGYV